jgi:two-component system response regulator YesN
MLRELELYFESLKQAPISSAMLNDIYQNYLQAVYHVLQIKGLQAHRICSGSLSTERASHAIRSVQNLKDWACQLTQTAGDYVASVKESRTVVEKVKLYIAENAHQNLSRESIASYVYLNPDYLSRLFKKSTGLALSEYLLEVRLKEAKKLLIGTSLTVSEIASSIGYTDFSHFSKMFRRMVRMNPLDYRKMNQ